MKIGLLVMSLFLFFGSIRCADDSGFMKEGQEASEQSEGISVCVDLLAALKAKLLALVDVVQKLGSGKPEYVQNFEQARVQRNSEKNVLQLKLIAKKVQETLEHQFKLQIDQLKDTHRKQIEELQKGSKKKTLQLQQLSQDFDKKKYLVDVMKKEIILKKKQIQQLKENVNNFDENYQSALERIEQQNKTISEQARVLGQHELTIEEQKKLIEKQKEDLQKFKGYVDQAVEVITNLKNMAREFKDEVLRCYGWIGLVQETLQKFNLKIPLFKEALLEDTEELLED